MLSEMSSTMRMIDQLTNICAPIVTGLLMTYGSTVISAVFIACWNLVSVFAEYGLLLRIYHRVQTLGDKVKPSAGMVITTCFKDS